MDKMSLEQFNNLKQRMKSLNQEMLTAYEYNEKNLDFNEEEFLKEFTLKCQELANQLLSHDLSLIPFESWEGLGLFFDENMEVDFSKTHANLDFKIIIDNAYGNFRLFNYKGCNVRNIEALGPDLRISSFDEETIKKNPNVFLSDLFSPKFKDKYYSIEYITFDDIKGFSTEQLNELKQNKFLLRKFDWRIIFIIRELGFDKLYELYNYYKEDYNYLLELISVPGFYFNEELVNKINQSDVSEIKNICIQFVRNNYLSYKEIEIEQTPEKFIKENEDIFLTNVNMPEDLRVRYYRRKLTLEDVLNNLDLFKNIPIENFMEYSEVKNFAISLGTGNFQKLLTSHLDVFNYLKEEKKFNHFLICYRNNEQLHFEENFSNAVKNYFLNNFERDYINPFFVLPDWLSSMNFKTVRRYDSIEELKTYDNSIIVLNKEQNKVLTTLELEHILKFEEETRFFSQGRNLHYLHYLDYLGSYLIKYSNNESFKTYEEFEKIISQFLSKQDKRIDYDFIKGKFREKYKNIFIAENAPNELKNLFYNRNISIGSIINNPDYVDYIKDTDIDLLFNGITITVEDNANKKVNLISYIKNKYGNRSGLNFILRYGKYLEIVNKQNRFVNIKLDSEEEIELITKIEELIYESIRKNGIMYDENLPEHFKETYPHLFLPEDTKEEIKEKFYNKKFQLKDFSDNPDLLKSFINTDIACGLSSKHSWAIGLLSDNQNLSKKIKILGEFDKINDLVLQKVFKDYILSINGNIEFSKIDIISELLFRLSTSNSSEISNFRNELANQLLLLDNPIDNLNKIEDIFLRNNLPTVGKIYSVFQILHPNCHGFDFNNQKVSPILKNNSTNNRNIIIFSDLLKTSIGSNNRSILSYLKNIEHGNNLFDKLRLGTITIDELSEKDKQTLSIFTSHLNTLYNNSKEGKQNPRKLLGNLEQDLNDLLILFKTNDKYDLPDRIVRMFGYFAGFKSFEQIKNYFEQTIKDAEKRNRYNSKKNYTLEPGDLVKGIGDITYLSNILQNGSVSKEFLGSSAQSDATPLDTDVSMILKAHDNINDSIESLAAKDYGPIWIVLKKNDNKFVITRNHTDTTETNVNRQSLSKLEIFYTGVLGTNHYGIRTGFSSSDIDYFITNQYDPRIGLEIAMNGFYIPVVDKTTGKLVFTPEDYDNLRKKMNGLSYYGIDSYELDNSIHRESKEISDIIRDMENNENETKNKANLIKDKLKQGASKLGLNLNENIDLSVGSVVLFNTGSTGRLTNLPGDGDFDYTMQVDQKIYYSEEKMEELRQQLITQLSNGKKLEFCIVSGDIRELKTTVTDEFGNECPVEIDITFTIKTDKTEYASDVCVNDRLNSINDKQERNLVKANIILAKKFLKSIEAYKPARKFPEQGGMGGIGVENWILQNGGTLYSAAKSFMEAVSKCSTFDEFIQMYSLPNFGYNHMAYKKGFYPHDDYIKNMNENGYNKMKKALNIYIKKYEENAENPVFEAIEELKNVEKNVEQVSTKKK